MKRATKRPVSDERLLDYVRNYIREMGVAPRWEDIVDGLLYTSRGVVHRHLWELRDKGWLTWDDGKTRTIRVLVGDSELVSAKSEPEPVNLSEPTEVVLGAVKAYLSELRLRAKRVGSGVLLDVVDELSEILSR